jgi:AcrR family transcriptional regulator
MARKKDADKRQLILAEAKRMFADKGYEGTSMGALAREIEIPVGSLYTYFDSKETLLNTIIEEGWSEFAAYLEEGIAVASQPASVSRPAAASRAGQTADVVPRRKAALAKLAFLVRRALPALFEDLDLIAILLGQAGRTSHLGEKLGYLASFIASIIEDYGKDGDGSSSLEIPELKAGLAVMLLGSLESMRLIHRTEIGVAAEDLIAFLVSTVEAALGCALPAVVEQTE